jgi:mRNA m6A methyltransferase non-catalytic subunit
MKSSLASADELLDTHAQLTARVRASQKEHRRILANLPSPPQSLLSLPLLPSPPPSPPASPLLAATSTSSRTQNGLLPNQKVVRPDLAPAKRARVARYANYVPEEETIRNDYSQRYVDGGEWPQNWVQGAEPERRFEE